MVGRCAGWGLLLQPGPNRSPSFGRPLRCRRGWGVLRYNRRRNAPAVNLSPPGPMPLPTWRVRLFRHLFLSFPFLSLLHFSAHSSRAVSNCFIWSCEFGTFNLFLPGLQQPAPILTQPHLWGSASPASQLPFPFLKWVKLK